MNTQTLDEDKKILTELNQRIGQAEKGRDAHYLFTVLSNDLIFRRANGEIVDKEKYLFDLLNPQNTYEELKSEEINPEIYNNMAVVVLRIYAKGTREGKAFEGNFHNVRIFIKEPDKQPQWQLHNWFNVKESL